MTDESAGAPPEARVREALRDRLRACGAATSVTVAASVLLAEPVLAAIRAAAAKADRMDCRYTGWKDDVLDAALGALAGEESHGS